MRKQSKSERAKLTRKLDGLIREIVRLRDEDTCQRCNKYVEGSDSHPHHIVPKMKGASLRRFDLLNIILLCMRCHKQWWHLNILDANEWFEEKYQARYDYLWIYRGGKPAKISTPEMIELVVTLKRKIEELKPNQ